MMQVVIYTPSRYDSDCLTTYILAALQFFVWNALHESEHSLRPKVYTACNHNS